MKTARALALAFGWALLPAAASAQGITPEQVVSIRAVSGVALSPDARHVAYTVTTPRDSAEARGASYSELYVAETAGDHPTLIVGRPASASSVSWSADGRQLGFVAQLGDRPARQVYAVPVTGGAPAPLTRSLSSVATFRWLPDGGVVYIAAGSADPAALPPLPGADQDGHPTLGRAT